MTTRHDEEEDVLAILCSCEILVEVCCTTKPSKVVYDGWNWEANLPAFCLLCPRHYFHLQAGNQEKEVKMAWCS